jgi:hypothetical protein
MDPINAARNPHASVHLSTENFIGTDENMGTKQSSDGVVQSSRDKYVCDGVADLRHVVWASSSNHMVVAAIFSRSVFDRFHPTNYRITVVRSNSSMKTKGYGSALCDPSSIR